ncbi:MAG: STAS domain-containing protein [Planctomycetota bacterium]|jgi:anti-sigma B factor antagonist
MPNLSYTTEEIEGAIKVDLKGSIDPGTFEDFQGLFDTLLGGSVFNIVINFEELTYINSTGMGLMVQVVDQFNEKDGQIILMSIPPKVMLVMEMLGLQEFFTIVPDVQGALAVFAGGEAPASSVEMHLKEEGTVVDRDQEATTASVECGHCGVTLTVSAAGSYQCPRCRSVLKVSGSGAAETIPVSDAVGLDLSLPADLEYIQGARVLIGTAGMSFGVGPEQISAICAAIDGCSKILIEEALGGSAKERIHLCLSSSDQGVSVELAAAGKVLSLSEEALASHEALAKVAGGPCRVTFIPSSWGNRFRICLK